MVLDLQAARQLADEDNRGVAIAQLDLPNRAPRSVDLTQDPRRASLTAPRRPTGTKVAADPDLNGYRRRIEVGPEHQPVAIIAFNLAPNRCNEAP